MSTLGLASDRRSLCEGCKLYIWDRRAVVGILPVVGILYYIFTHLPIYTIYTIYGIGEQLQVFSPWLRIKV
jgi:hypothetical protein